MDNNTIADNFSLLAKLMEIHGENSFKIKSYSNAAFVIEKLPVELSSLPEEKIFSIKGIGDAIGKKIISQLDKGSLKLLDDYLANTPGGILEMLRIKGIGPKKIATIWKELEIENIGELLYACNENRLLLFKGFGAKTQQNIKDSIEFFQKNIGSYQYAAIEDYALAFTQKIQENFPDLQCFPTGIFRRNMPVIDKLEWVTTIEKNRLTDYFEKNGYKKILEEEESLHFKGEENVLLIFYLATEVTLFTKLFRHSCSEEFLNAWLQKFSLHMNYADEAAIFSEAGVAFIAPFLRETEAIILKAIEGNLPVLIESPDVRAVIHSHSKWSDGLNSIEEMAVAAKEKGYEYLVISDHSKSAFYANGLDEKRIFAQHEEIDALNKKLTPFKIFKSIESDILNDGSLDYPENILKTFDLVIASVHSNLKMTEEKAMVRLMAAIQNPFTNILGHMTGRLLLSRNGYPVDHEKIIDACAKHNVVIEINAHPKRLDIDWKWIPYCLEKNVLLSIDPDAHSIHGFADIRYGVLAAQKGGLTKEKNLSSFSLAAFELFLKAQHAKRKT
ncbi:MAG: helix-hairpin-helix domain-containing protein [Bacteroidota bacterium]